MKLLTPVAQNGLGSAEHRIAIRAPEGGFWLRSGKASVIVQQD